MRFSLIAALLLLTAGVVDSQFLQHRRKAFRGGGSSLLTGIIAAYHLDEASGNALDADGNTHDLTDTNTVTATTGKLSGARQFTASSSEYFTKADHADFSMGSGKSITIAAWVYLDNISTSRIVVGKTSSANEYLLYYSGASSAFEVYVENASSTPLTVTDTALTVTTATWYYVVAWFDSSTGTLAIQCNNDATPDTNTSGGFVIRDGASDFRIGEHGGFAWMDGRLDEVVVWNRVLTADERTALYNSGNGLAYPF